MTRRGGNRTLTLFFAASIGCTGIASAPGTEAPGGGGSGPGAASVGGSLSTPDGLGPIGARRLTREELRLAVVDLLGVDPQADLELLPVDDETPFDNDYTTQQPSAALVSGLNSFAESVADRLVNDPSARDRALGCSPSGPGDTACLRSFVERIGRRTLRRPLSPSEVDEYVAFQTFAQNEDDFYVAVRMVLHAMLQDVEFTYRIEIGEPIAGQPLVSRLNDYELAARMSFLLWGSVPDDALLDAAASGDLQTSDGVRGQAARMIADPKTDQQLQRLHAMWLNYDDLAVPVALQDPMRRETAALLRRVVFQEGRPWRDVFTLSETYVTPELAAHYGFSTSTGSSEWVPYADAQRGGLLSHGSFLSTGSNFGDTSPVLRGKSILTRLLCRELPEPPPGVDIDEPPEFGGPDSCKPDIYAMNRTDPCSSCHASIDNAGWGLENFSADGQWRDHQKDRTDCPIDGQGSIDGIGAFSGPGELGRLLADSGELEACFAQQFYRFAVGRGEESADMPARSALATAFQSSGNVVDLFVSFIGSEAFRHRVVAE